MQNISTPGSRPLKQIDVRGILYRIFPEECGNIISNIRISWRPTYYMIRDVLCILSHRLPLKVVACREIAGSLSREERADRYRRVFMGWDARLLRRRGKAKPGDARRRKRVHLRQAHGRTTVPLRTNPRSGLWRRESCDTA